MTARSIKLRNGRKIAPVLNKVTSHNNYRTIKYIASTLSHTKSHRVNTVKRTPICTVIRTVKRLAENFKYSK